MGVHVGQRVRLSDTREVGVVIHLWIDPELGVEDAYVAFFGQEFPQGKPSRESYVLRYFADSLKPAK